MINRIDTHESTEWNHSIMGMICYPWHEAKAIFDDVIRVFHVEVSGQRDAITFQALSIGELQQARVDSIDEYVAFCALRGDEPETPSLRPA